MDNALDQLMHPGTVIYGVVIIVLTFFIRRLVETASPSVKKQADENDPKLSYGSTFSRYWNQVILYILPPAVGALIGIFNVEYLHGADGPAGLAGRVFNGIFVGGCSAMAYKLLKKRGVDLDQALSPSMPPSAPTE